MRKYYVILAVLTAVFIGSAAVAQVNRVTFQQEPYITIQYRGGFGADSMMRLPIKDTTVYFPSAGYDRRGQMVYRPQDSTVYYYTGRNWKAVGGNSGDGTTITWSTLPGKPSTFTPSAHTHSTNDITSGVLPVSRGGTGSATPGLVAGENVTITGTFPNQRIDAAGGGSSGGNADSLWKKVNQGARSSEYFLPQMVNTRNTRTDSISMGAGPNEYDWAYAGKGWYKFVYDAEGESRLASFYMPNGLDLQQIKDRLRTYQQAVNQVWDTPFDSSLAYNGDPFLEQVPNAKKYPTMQIDTNSGVITIIYYLFGQGSYTIQGRSALELRTVTPKQDGELAVMNDAQIDQAPGGKYEIIAKHTLMDGRYGVWEATAPSGPWLLRSMLDRPGAVDSSYAAQKFTDPAWYNVGDRKFAIYGHVTWRDTANFGGQIVRSSKMIVEYDHTSGKQLYMIGRPIGGFGGFYDGNPNYEVFAGKRYLVYSRFSGMYINFDPAQPIPDLPESQRGMLYFQEMSEDIGLPYGRDDKNIFQVFRGNPRELVSNGILDKYGSVDNTYDSGLRATAPNSGFIGTVNYVKWINMVVRGRIQIDALPAAGQYGCLFHVGTSRPQVDSAAVDMLINSDGQLGIRVRYSNGATAMSVFTSSGVALGSPFKFTWDQSKGTLVTDAGQVGVSMPMPFPATSFAYFSLLNRGTFATPKREQLIGRIFSLEMQKLPDPTITDPTAAGVSLAENRRMYLTGGLGNVPVTLPTATPESGYGYTTDGRGYYMVEIAGNGTSFTLSNTATTYSTPNYIYIFEYTPQLGYHLINPIVTPQVTGQTDAILKRNAQGQPQASNTLFVSDGNLMLYSDGVNPVRFSLYGPNNSAGDVNIQSSNNQVRVGYNNNFTMFLNVGAKNVGIGATPDGSSALDVQSTTGGFLAPRMTAAQASAIPNPAYGLEVNVTDTNPTFTQAGKWRFNGTIWKLMQAD